MICAFNGARELVEDRSESGHSGPEPPGAYSDSDIDLEHASGQSLLLTQWHLQPDCRSERCQWIELFKGCPAK